MPEWLAPLFANSIAVAFIIILLGLLLGRVKVAGISLGSSGVLFSALAFGHLGWVPDGGLGVLGQLGVILFVYAIGLQAGPRFLQTLRGKGVVPLLIALATVGGAALIAALAGGALGLQKELVVGIFAGALTSTPALAAATEVSDSPIVPVAYGVAYPLGVIAVVLFAQLLPRWSRRWQRRPDQSPDPEGNEPVMQRCFLVQNPGCLGKRVSDLKLHDLVSVNISRVGRGGVVLAASNELRLEKGDIVLAVGTSSELDRLTLLLGPPVPAEVELAKVPNVEVRDVLLSETAFAGQTLRHLHIRTKFDVVITRVRREGIEFVPRGDFVLEIGDIVRCVGYEPNVQAFSQAAGIREQRVHETGIAQFAFGLVLGLLAGVIPLPIPGIAKVTLGLAGGTLFVGLLLGHFGRIGPLRVHVPVAARYLMRELGLVLFLASAGSAAGARLMSVLQTDGVALLTLTAVTVVAAIAIGAVLAYTVFKQSVPSMLGMTCGAMTSTPGLGAASAQFESDVPALSYAAVYPLALVAMTVIAQLMLLLMP
jgi:putative transport protein